MTDEYRRENGIDSCSKCGSMQVIVINSRSRDYGRYRAKKCEKCDYRFSTVEMLKTYVDGLRSNVFSEIKVKIIDILNGTN